MAPPTTTDHTSTTVFTSREMDDVLAVAAAVRAQLAAPVPEAS